METRDELRAVYGRVVYSKGGAVLRMLEQWLGEEPLQRSLRRYLKAHTFGTATTGDLTAAIQAETGVDVAAVLSSAS
jgi:aminopeptidase N